MAKALVIDDEPDIRAIIQMALGDFGDWDVTEASGGAEGLRLAEQTRPDLILLDVMMPVMDGAATLVRLRQNPVTAGIPVIFLTAKAQRSEIDRLLSLGPNGVLTKPFDPVTLPGQVAACLKNPPRT